MLIPNLSYFKVLRRGYTIKQNKDMLDTPPYFIPFYV